MKPREKTKFTKKFVEKHLHEFTEASAEQKAVGKALRDKTKSECAAKDAKINMRVNGEDLEALVRLAEKKGMGYQTLLGSIIHQYVTDQLVDIAEAKKILKIKKVG